MDNLNFLKIKKVDRYANIDGLRTFGCLAIIAWHIKANTSFQLGSNIIIDRVIPSWDYLVYLFMIISGFGMCNGYYENVKQGKFDINAFYQKRYRKNVPFFVLLIVVDLFIERSISAFYEGMMEVTMLFGFLPNNNLSVIGVSWTLGAIFAFYIIFPYFVFLIYNKRRAWFSFAVSLLITNLCQVYFMTDKFVNGNFVPRHAFLFCLPYFIGGGLIYLYKEKIQNLLEGKILGGVVVCIIVTISYYLIPDQVWGFSFVVVKTLILYVIWLSFAIGCRNNLMSNRVTRAVSDISMEMYLSHMIVFRVVQKFNIGKFFNNDYITYLLTYTSVVVLLVIGITVYKKVISHARFIHVCRCLSNIRK